jgi:hypothetical protein
MKPFLLGALFREIGAPNEPGVCFFPLSPPPKSQKTLVAKKKEEELIVHV